MNTDTRKLALMSALMIVLLPLLVISAAGQTMSFALIHNFTGQGDGGAPGYLKLDGQGNLYGETYNGGAYNQGTVFKMTRGSRGWGLKTLYNFGVGPNDGTRPWGLMVQDANGVIYGGTQGGSTGLPTVFSLTPPPLGSLLAPWTETQLHVFGQGDDGDAPNGLAMDATGDTLYGTTWGGGTYTEGTVFKLTRGAEGWTYQVLYSFPSTDDGNPHSGVTVGPDGNLYGTVAGNGPPSCGNVYQMTPSGSRQVVYTFTGTDDGCSPVAGVVFDQLGNLYGATAEGGANGGGVVFELSAGSWGFTPLYSLTGDPRYWDGPQATPSSDTLGNLYVTTVGLGSNHCGSAFKLTHGSGSWSYRLLHDFTCRPPDGGDPSNLVVDAHGWVYGTTRYDWRDSSYNIGAVWEILR